MSECGPRKQQKTKSKISSWFVLNKSNNSTSLLKIKHDTFKEENNIQ